MDLKLLEKQIRKTGFVLENRVAHWLKAAGWTVISNKYYVDDFEESVREIDLVAYQVQKAQHLDVFTVLVISCKKSESNIWALLAREANLRDPNSDWWPLHAWSNDKAINFQLSEPNVARRCHDDAVARGVREVLGEPSVEVFAFQEMDGKSGAPRNDKPIFFAVTSLMKAQAYELGALPLRKKLPCVYQFNLISVVDAEMARLMFRGNVITSEPIDSEQYLARYIVKKKETFSRIRFIKSSAFPTALDDYNRLHRANVAWLNQQCDAFYDGIMTDYRRNRVLIDDFKEQVGGNLSRRIRDGMKLNVDFNDFWFYWDVSNKVLHVEVFADENVITFLNSDDASKARVGVALSSVYRYTGSFVFAVDDIPF